MRKSTVNMIPAIHEFMQQFKLRKYEETKPAKIQFDDGVEFTNVGVRQYLLKSNVEYFSTYSDKKAAIVERFSRTLKTMMWQYFHSVGTHKWIDVLDDLVKNYNHTKHRTIYIGKKPIDVNVDNESEVWMTLYGYHFADTPIPKFKVGDKDRISRYKSTFSKGYEANFSESLYKVTNVLRSHPIVYTLEDLSGEPILGKFYEEELSGVEVDDNKFVIEIIIKRKKVRGKSMVLVKWTGSNKTDWIPEVDTDQFR